MVNEEVKKIEAATEMMRKGNFIFFLLYPLSFMLYIFGGSFNFYSPCGERRKNEKVKTEIIVSLKVLLWDDDWSVFWELNVRSN